MTLLKTIVLGLVLANVGYFLWLRGIAKSQAVPTAAPATLKLAAEVAPASRSAAADAGRGAGAVGGTPAGASADESGPGVPGSVQRCISVGPFRDVSEAAHAASTLRGAGYDPRQRVVDGDVWAGVWVYLPIAATRAVSEPLLAKLKAAGIDDALEMPGPTEGSVISLGLYSEQRRAQARVAQVQALGLTPATADRKRTGNVYWIDVDLKPADGQLNPAVLQAEAGRITRVELKACPTPTTQP